MAIFRGSRGSTVASGEVVATSAEILDVLNQAVDAKDDAEEAQVAAELAQSNAETAESGAEDAQQAAESAQSSAETAQSNAEDAQSYAEEWANKPEDSLVSTAAGGDGVDDYSALHWSIKSSDSAAAALQSEQNAAPVNAIVAEIQTVAGIDSQVVTVAGISSDVTDVANNEANVTIVATDIANVNTVGTNIADVTTVATDITNVNTTATNILDVNTVAGISADVTSVAIIDTDVTTAADNIQAIIDAPQAATDAATARDKAQDWATEAEDVEVEPGLFSAFHWAQKAEDEALSFTNSPAATITSTQISNWDTAYSWGDHALEGYLTSVSWGDIGGTLSNQTDLQSALDAKIDETADTGSAVVPAGTQAQRDGTPSAGYFRFNTDTQSFEGYNGIAWGSVGGGATGGGGDQVFVENDQIVTTDYTISADKNAMTTGPIDIDDGVVVTVETGARWVII